MTARLTRGVYLATGVVTIFLTISVLGLLLWGAWRLLFWGVVAAAPHAHYRSASGITTTGAIPPGFDTMVAGAGSALAMLAVAGFLILVCLLLTVVALADRETSELASVEEAYVHGEIDDEEFARRRRLLTGERDDRIQ